MKLTKSADFGCRVVLYLAKQDDIVSMPVIAKALYIPYNHLVKLVQKLSRANIVVTKQGKMGGLSLAVPPDKITLKHVVDCIDGQTVLAPCFRETYTCELDSCCQLKNVFETVQTRFDTILMEYTFLDIMSQNEQKNLSFQAIAR